MMLMIIIRNVIHDVDDDHKKCNAVDDDHKKCNAVDDDQDKFSGTHCGEKRGE